MQLINQKNVKENVKAHIGSASSQTVCCKMLIVSVSCMFICFIHITIAELGYILLLMYAFAISVPESARTSVLISSVS